MIFNFARRYCFSTTSGHRAASIRTVLASALSAAVFLLISSSMTALQEGRFDEIRDVRSFDIVTEGSNEEVLKSKYPEADVFTYAEGDAIIMGKSVTIRYIDENYSGGIRILRGNSDGLLVPYSLWLKSRGNPVEVTRLVRSVSGRTVPKTEEFTVSGIYMTELGSDFDDNHVFLPISLSGDERVFTAVKGSDDISGIEFMNPITWKESENALYFAFITEKAAMYTVLSFLFLVIFVSMNSGAKRFYRDKTVERASLRVLGMSGGKISASFSLSYIILVVSGIILGVSVYFILRPFVSLYLFYFTFRETELRFPFFVCFVLIAVNFVSVLVITTFLRRGEMKKDISEVINGNCT